ncbi:MAG: hypothetical protein WAL29_08225, partial [Bacteroidales bacterium]
MDEIKGPEQILKTPLGRFTWYSIKNLVHDGYNAEELPFSIRILLENIIRNQNNKTFTRAHLNNILSWKPN